MSRPPIDLDDPTAVCDAFAAIPMRVRPRHTDLVMMVAASGHQADLIVCVDDVPDASPHYELVQALGRIWRQLRAEMTDLAVAVALCRRGDPRPSGNDLAWHDAIMATAAHAGIACTGVYLSTPRDTVRVLPHAA